MGGGMVAGGPWVLFLFRPQFRPLLPWVDGMACCRSVVYRNGSVVLDLRRETKEQGRRKR